MYARRVSTYNRRRSVTSRRVVRRPRVPYRSRVQVRVPRRRARIVRRR